MDEYQWHRQFVSLSACWLCSRGTHEQNHRNRPRHYELGRRRHGRRRARGHHQPRRWATHAVGGRVHEDRRAPRRAGCQAPGGHESGEHRLLDQAVHGPQVRRSQRGDEDGAVPGRPREQRRRAGERQRQGVLAAGDLRDDSAEAEAGGRGIPRVSRSPRRSSRCRRTSTTRSDRPPRTPARSPASRSCASSTSRRRRRSPTASTRRRTRPSPCTTSAAARSTSRSSKWAKGVVEVKATNGDTHLGRRQPRSAHHRLDHRRVQEERRHRSRQGPDGAAAPEGGGGEGEDGALHRDGDRHQPAVHHGGSDRSQASADEADAREVRAAGGGSAAEDGRADQAGARRRRARPLEDRRGRARRRVDAHPEGAGDRQGALRQGTAQGRQSGRGRRRRRRGAGRRAGRRRQGSAAARRDAALARHRDAGRRDDHADHRGTRPSRRARARSSRRPPTIRRASRSTCCRASGRWRATTGRSAGSI